MQGMGSQWKVVSDVTGSAYVYKVGSGSYTYTCSHADYTVVTGSVYVDAEHAKPKTISITLVRPGPTPTPTTDINCTVKNKQSSPVSGARCQLRHGDEVVYSCTTDTRGQCTLSGVQSGDYTYKCLHEDYSEYTENVSVDAKTHTPETINAVLEDKPLPTLDIKVSCKNTRSQPVEGVSVALLQGGAVRYMSKTGSAGGATLKAVLSGSYTFQAIHDAYQSYTAPVNVDAQKGTPESIDIVLEEKTQTTDVPVKVIDEEGNPIGNAQCTLEKDETGEKYTIVTDIAGMATYKNLTSGGYIHTVRHTDYQTYTATVTVDAEKHLPKELDVILEKTRTTMDIPCSVHSTQGAPLFNAIIQLIMDETIIQTVRTGGDGSATLRNVQSGEYNVHVEDEGYVAQTSSITVDVESGTPEKLSWRLEEEPTMDLTVTVRDEQASPVNLADVKLIMDGSTKHSASTDKNGVAELIEVKSGPYTLKVDHDGYDGYTGDVTIDAEKKMPKDIPVTLRKQLQPLDIPVKTTDASDEPLGNVKVTLKGSSTEYTTTTNEQGTSTLKQVAGGDYTYTATRTGYKDAAGKITVDLDKRTPTQLVIKLEEKPAPTSDIPVHVDNEDGDVLENADIALLKDGKTIQSVKTNASGDTTLVGVYDGKYKVQVSHTDYISQEEDVTVNSESHTPGSLDYTLKKLPVMDLIVNVRDKYSNPLSDVLVTLEGSSVKKTMKTDTDGSVILDNIRSGEYTLTCTHDEYKTNKQQVTVDAQKGTPKSVKVVMEERVGLDITVTVYDWAKREIGAQKVTLYDEAGAVVQEIETDPFTLHGTLQNVYDGRYTVKTNLEDHQPYSEEFQVFVDEKRPEKLDLYCKTSMPVQDIQVTTIDRNSHKLSGVQVVISDNMGSLMNLYTNNEGYAIIHDLPDLPNIEQTYTVSCYLKNYKDYHDTFQCNKSRGLPGPLQIIMDYQAVSRIQITAHDEKGESHDWSGQQAQLHVAETGEYYMNTTFLKNGIATFKDVPENQYYITSRPTGYDRYTSNMISVHPDEQELYTLDVTFKRMTKADITLDILEGDDGKGTPLDAYPVELWREDGTGNCEQIAVKNTSYGKVTFPDLPAGYYYAYPVQQGRQWLTETIKINLDVNPVEKILVVKKCPENTETQILQVHDPDDKQQTSAYVYLIKDRTIMYEGIADRNAYFHVDNVAYGTYRLEVRERGGTEYNPHVEEEYVVDGKTDYNWERVVKLEKKTRDEE